MKRVLFSGLGLMAFFLIAMVQGPVSTEACSCAPPPDPVKALAQSAAVFLGKVVAIDDAPGGGFFKSKVVTIDVEKWWKGGEDARVKVTTSGDGASCGYGFQQGNRYLVYCYSLKGGPLQVSLCSRTRPAQTAEGTGDLKDLGEGKAPSKK